MKKLILTIFVTTSLLPRSLNSQTDFREEAIYFLMTTRFFDGDPNNNAPTEWSSYNPDPAINQGKHIYELNRENILKASGVYFCRITIDGTTQIKKIAVY